MTKDKKKKKLLVIVLLLLMPFGILNAQFQSFPQKTQSPIRDISFGKDGEKILSCDKGFLVSEHPLIPFDTLARSKYHYSFFSLFSKNRDTILAYSGYEGSVLIAHNNKLWTLPCSNNCVVSDIEFIDNMIWVSTVGSGLFLINKEETIQNFTSLNSKLKSNNVYSMEKGEEGYLWIGTQKGISVFNGKGFINPKLVENNKNYANNESVTAISFQKGLLWIANIGRLKTIKDSRITNIELPQKMRSCKITTITFDKTGNLWLSGDFLASLNLSTEREWTIFGHEEGYYGIYSLCIGIDSSETVWVGTEGHGLFYFNLNPREYSSSEFQNIKPTIDSLEDGFNIKVENQNELVTSPPKSIIEDSLKNSLETSSKYIIPNLFFEKNSTRIIDPSVLDEIVIFLENYPFIRIKLVGHTYKSQPLSDLVETEKIQLETHKDFSLKRANSVRDYLVSKGIHEDRITCVGKGYLEPIYEGSERGKNKRVEVILIKSQ